MNESPRTIALDHLPEPKLRFAYERTAEDPKTGLFIYGPPSSAIQGSYIRLGIIGTGTGLSLARRWIRRMRGHIPATRSDSGQYLPFPGFETVFGMRWADEPTAEIVLDEATLLKLLFIGDVHQRVHAAVSMYGSEIRRHIIEEESIVDVWLVVIPDDVYRYCRPRSLVSRNEAITSPSRFTRRMSRYFLGPQKPLFPEDAEAVDIYRYHPDFHNQLKARLLNQNAIVQIVRESTLIPQHVQQPRIRQDDSMVAWNISTALYYKAGERPWQLSGVRRGVCYIGLVFKKDETDFSSKNVCCGAQLFLSNGDGVVFKVSKGDFASKGKNNFHLSYSIAQKLAKLAVRAFSDQMNGDSPREIFVHGKTWFNKEEYDGLVSGVPKSAKVTCVRIRSSSQLKLFTRREMPVLRGTTFVRDNRSGFLWTRGFVPQIGTYPGREVPNPLSVDVVFGNTPIKDILSDLLALTKVNFNSCIFGDGLPVTIRFANAVGEILTSAPIEEGRPLPFRHYI